LLVCSHVWTEAINSSSNKAFFNELHGISSCNSLKLVL
jgi:hypothetical protein